MDSERRERTIGISVRPGFVLEGRRAEGRREEIAVLCHPLPRYGGTMDSAVVVAAQRAMAELGMTTIRFNFRGVGASDGRSTSGLDEVEDLEGVVASSRSTVGSGARLHLLGYSYGAWIVGHGLSRGIASVSATLISPPVDFLDHDGIVLPAIPTLIVSGDEDQFGSAAGVEGWLAKQGSVDLREHVVLAGVDHFYSTGMGRLARAIGRFFGGRSLL
jgi:uncharacterized protein